MNAKYNGRNITFEILENAMPGDYNAMQEVIRLSFSKQIYFREIISIYTQNLEDWLYNGERVRAGK